MALYRDARPQVLAAINAANSINLKMADVVFSAAEAVADITPAPTTTKNSRTILTAAPSAPYSGKVPAFYDRLSFTKVFEHTPVNTYAKLRSFRPQRIHDLIPDLNNYYGLELTKADILDGELTLVDGVGSAVIEATPASLTWTGKFTVSIIPGDLALEKHMTVTDLKGIDYPSGQSVKGQAEVYSYYYDCSAYEEYLDAIEVVTEGGEDLTDSFVDFINGVTGGAWTLAAAGNYSLVDAKIIYNGANSLNKQSNHNFDFICEVKLSAACANFAGILRFHYNKTTTIDTVARTTSLNVDLGTMTGADPTISTDASYRDGSRYNPYYATVYNDYSSQAAFLKTVPWQSAWTSASNAVAQGIANALKAVDGLPWTMVVNSPALDYNLYAVYVSYNGPVANAPKVWAGKDMEYDQKFTHVMLITPPFQQQGNLWYSLGVVYYNVA